MVSPARPKCYPRNCFTMPKAQRYLSRSRLPEYYPTRTEAAILADNADEICSRLRPDVSVSELGAGTATKTRILLRSLLRRQQSVDYFPLDVSDSALQLGKHELECELTAG